MTVKNKAIRAARDWYREKGEAGWWRGPDHKQGSTHCPFTICGSVCPQEFQRTPKYEHLHPEFFEARNALAAVVGKGVNGFLHWNDDPARTFAEVLAVVEAADLALNGADS